MIVDIGGTLDVAKYFGRMACHVFAFLPLVNYSLLRFFMAELSPAAQAVLNVLNMDELNGLQQILARAHAVAVLHAIALEVILPKYQYADWEMANLIMEELQAIAAELEDEQ